MKSIILATILMCASISTYDELPKVTQPDKLVSTISEKYKVDPKRVQYILHIINTEVDHKFPKKKDVLAIIAIESEFREEAISHKKAKGLMQILYKKTRNTEENIIAGIDLLREYRRRLGSEKAAIHAYNVGIGNYKLGIRNHTYYTKYAKEKSQLQHA